MVPAAPVTGVALSAPVVMNTVRPVTVPAVAGTKDTVGKALQPVAAVVIFTPVAVKVPATVRGKGKVAPYPPFATPPR